MAQRRKQRVRQKGKISFSRYFQELKPGDKVAIKPEESLPFPTSVRFKGKIGVVESKKGRAYVIKLKEGKTYKKAILRPVHLIKVE